MAAALEPTSSVPAFEKVSCASENAGRASSDAAVEPAAAERNWRRETALREPIHHLATMSAVNQCEQTFTIGRIQYPSNGLACQELKSRTQFHHTNYFF